MPRTMPRTKSVQTLTRKIRSQSLVLLISFPYSKPPYSKNLGGGTPPRGASIRRPSGDGVSNNSIQVFLSFQLLVLGPSSLPSSSPTPPESSPLAPCGLYVVRRAAALAPLGLKNWCSNRPSKTDQILMLFQHRFLSVLAPFWKPKMAPKSIKNRSKSSFRALLFPHRFLYRFLINFSS